MIILTQVKIIIPDLIDYKKQLARRQAIEPRIGHMKSDGKLNTVKPLTGEDKKNEQQLSRDRVLNENVIGSVKRFKILSDRYRNRRKRFSLRFNLIAGIYNLELAQ